MIAGDSAGVPASELGERINSRKRLSNNTRFLHRGFARVSHRIAPARTHARNIGHTARDTLDIFNTIDATTHSGESTRRADTAGKLELDKENWPPRGMAHPLSAKKTNMDGKQHTPGRRGRTGNQYFDVGKVGRKTGITLKDTGLRDEYGMEPMAGIFSSPVKEASPKKGSDGTMSSEPMAVQDSESSQARVDVSASGYDC